MDLTPLGEGCGVGSPELATTGSGVFGNPDRISGGKLIGNRRIRPSQSPSIQSVHSRVEMIHGPGIDPGGVTENSPVFLTSARRVVMDDRPVGTPEIFRMSVSCVPTGPVVLV